jgi:hypothetical protein
VRAPSCPRSSSVAPVQSIGNACKHHRTSGSLAAEVYELRVILAPVAKSTHFGKLTLGDGTAAL